MKNFAIELTKLPFDLIKILLMKDPCKYCIIKPCCTTLCKTKICQNARCFPDTLTGRKVDAGISLFALIISITLITFNIVKYCM